VALVERAIRNSSKSRDIVLDPFGGSGSTLIACEKTGRQARLVELDPKYVDVIVQRWQDWAGATAVLEGDGRTYEEVAVGREAPPNQFSSNRNGSVICDQRPSLGGSSTSSASPVSP
jgi:hypothetical protein